jgi:hypothetical protein
MKERKIAKCGIWKLEWKRGKWFKYGEESKRERRVKNEK